MSSAMQSRNGYHAIPTITEPCRCYAIPNQGIDHDLWTSAWRWADRNRVCCEVHLARLRFWIPERLETEWLLRYGDTVYRVPEHDYI